MSTKHISAEVISIEDLPFQELHIPQYQRPYVWTEQNVIQLLEDIHQNSINKKSKYRIGSIILHKSSSNKYEIVDGQQRIATLLLILTIHNDDAVNKAGNMRFYHQVSVENIIVNQDIIRQWFKTKLDDNGKNEFFNYLQTKCEVVRIIVEERYLSEAFQMFDSQNGKGKELEPYNLLKAYHIRAMKEDEDVKIACDQRWEAAACYEKTGKPRDLLKQVINEHLYRSRQWSKSRDAWKFTKKVIQEFKGIDLYKDNKHLSPRHNTLWLHFFYEHFADKGFEIHEIQSRVTGCEDKHPFCSVNQPIINGRLFFDYIDNYVDVYKMLFTNTESTSAELSAFHEFYQNTCRNSNTCWWRTGDSYLRELYKSLTILVFDMYGISGLLDYMRVLYILVYNNRLEYRIVKYSRVARFPKEIFGIIANSQTLFELNELKTKANVIVNKFKKLKDIPKSPKGAEFVYQIIVDNDNR